MGMEVMPTAPGTGVLGFREPGKPPMVWQRDLANCLPFVLQNTVILVQGLYDGKRQELEVLDTIVQMTHHSYMEARRNNVTGLMGFGELLRYIQSEGGVGQEVYNTFTGVFYVGIFTFLYGSREMAIESPDTLNTESCYDYQQFLSMISQVSPESRIQIIQDFRKNMVFPSSFNTSNLIRKVDELLEKVKADQQKRYSKDE